MALDCGAGKYLNNGACADCNPGYQAVYCPGDNLRHSCPGGTNTRYADLLNITVTSLTEPIQATPGATNAIYCQSRLDAQDPNGNRISITCNYRATMSSATTTWTDGYYYCGVQSYTAAGTGWYLSTERIEYYDEYNQFISKRNLPYPCTNAPAHAHYTGPGTGGDNCPWECDAGYGRHGDTCAILCAAGATTLRTDNLSFNIYSGTSCTTPAIYIGLTGGTCCVNLAPDFATGAINIDYGGATYHTVD